MKREAGGTGRVVAASLVMALALLGDSLLYVVLPLHAAALGLSGLQTGILLSANRFVRMVTNGAAVRLGRRMRAGPLFSGAAALAALTTALYAAAPPFALFLGARLLWGLSFSALRLSCFLTVLAAATDRSRGRLMGLYQSISRAGSFTAVMVGGTLFDAFGYRAALLAMTAGTLLAVPLAATAASGIRHPLSGGSGTPLPGSPLSALRSSAAALLAVKFAAFALSFVVRGVVTATLALLLRDRFGQRLGPVGVATAAAWLIGVRWAAEIGLAAPLGALSDRVGRIGAAMAWLLVAAAAVMALALAPGALAVAAAAGLLFVAAAGLSATLDAAAGDLAPPEQRAAVMSSYADWADLGAALGPLLALTFAGWPGLRPAYLTGAALLLLATLAMSRAGRARAAKPG